MVTVEEIYLPLTLSAPGLTDAQFQDFCEQYADFRLEYTAEGELVIKPLADPETSALGVVQTRWAGLRDRPVAGSRSPTARASLPTPRGFREPGSARSNARSSSSSCSHPRTARASFTQR